MVCCTVLSDMRLDIDHAYALAQELLRFTFTPVAQGTADSTSGDGMCTRDFQAAVDTALNTYTDNVTALLHTVHEMGKSALNTLTVVGNTDADLAGEFTGQQAGVST